MRPTVPDVDPEVRRRLTVRFGNAVHPWLDELRDTLSAFAEPRHIQFVSAIPRGSVSAVFHCRSADGVAAVLKTSPDRARLALEAKALLTWDTKHTPAVLEFDEQLGILVMEAIEPGTALIDPPAAYPTLDLIAGLLTSLHDSGMADSSFPTVTQRVGSLFDSSLKLYERRPELTSVVSFDLFERGRDLARWLATFTDQSVLLHGDFTPRNILDGGARGLVAIDPAPCIGDAGFDAIDLILWQASDVGTIEQRAERLSAATGMDPERVLAWCSAFAGMNALELADDADPSDPADPNVEVLREVALNAEPRV